jgi:hypothetical protein
LGDVTFSEPKHVRHFFASTEPPFLTVPRAAALAHSALASKTESDHYWRGEESGRQAHGARSAPHWPEKSYTKAVTMMVNWIVNLKK